MGDLAVGSASSTPRLWQRVDKALLLGLAALLLDQCTKLAAKLSLSPGEAVPDDARLRLTNVANPGILFGAPASSLVSLLLPLAMMLVVLALYWRFRRSPSTLLGIGTGLFVGGTLGNLTDRIFCGEVTDFIEVVSAGGDSSMVFNLADLCILAGIVLLEAFFIRLIIRVIIKKGLRYNPLKVAFVRMMQRGGGGKPR
jgi:signal peptidase II